MNAIGIFSIEVIISLSMSLFILWVLEKPLINVLKDLCPTKTQADFWLAYTRIMLLITPLLLGMLIVGKKIFEPASKQCSINAE
jgi:hypothetical protein